MKEMIAGMTTTFNPAAAGDLKAVIQFVVTGGEPGEYHLQIEDGGCSFHEGLAAKPSMTITTPSEVWQAISRGEIKGQLAFATGKYKARGKLGLLLKMDRLFPAYRD